VEAFESLVRERGRRIEAAGFREKRVGLEGARDRCPKPASGNRETLPQRRVRGEDAGTVRSVLRVQEGDPDGDEVLPVLRVDL
jgi:hypothetical protein